MTRADPTSYARNSHTQPRESFVGVRWDIQQQQGDQYASEKRGRALEHVVIK